LAIPFLWKNVSITSLACRLKHVENWQHVQPLLANYAHCHCALAAQVLHLLEK
jgi:hypothetical protein